MELSFDNIADEPVENLGLFTGNINDLSVSDIETEEDIIEDE